MSEQKNIAIVGAAPSSRMLAPYHDDAWECWGINTSYHWQPVWHRWFDIHDPETIKSGNPDHWQWLTQQTKPIVMQRQIKEIPASVAYPLDDVRKEFGEYLTNSVSYMLALAITLKPKVIGLWGVDMAQDNTKLELSEYAHQRPSCEFFVGIAKGRGIEVVIAPESDLLKTQHLYGFGVKETSQLDQKLTARMNELQTRIDTAEAEIKAMGDKYRQWLMDKNNEVAILAGALEEAKYQRQWLPHVESYEETE